MFQTEIRRVLPQPPLGEVERREKLPPSLLFPDCVAPPLGACALLIGR